MRFPTKKSKGTVAVTSPWACAKLEPNAANVRKSAMTYFMTTSIQEQPPINPGTQFLFPRNERYAVIRNVFADKKALVGNKTWRRLLCTCGNRAFRIGRPTSDTSAHLTYRDSKSLTEADPGGKFHCCGI